jgi:hypothetical protein
MTTKDITDLLLALQRGIETLLNEEHQRKKQIAQLCEKLEEVSAERDALKLRVSVGERE